MHLEQVILLKVKAEHVPPVIRTSHFAFLLITGKPQPETQELPSAWLPSSPPHRAGLLCPSHLKPQTRPVLLWALLCFLQSMGPPQERASTEGRDHILSTFFPAPGSEEALTVNC